MSFIGIYLSRGGARCIMYINSGYLHNSLLDFKDKSKPLVVGSCGTYRLIHQPKLPTYRPSGRIDYQLLYIAAGKGHFFLNGKEEMIDAGHMILYKPREMQRYVYYGTDQTEVYWVHFTGNNVKNILKEYHLFESGQIIQTGNSTEYHQIFRKMIQELQLTRPHYEEYLSLLLRELFLLISRQAPVGTSSQNRILQKEVEKAAQYFNEHFAEDLSIEEYAVSKHLSTCWFIRSFKRYNGLTPMQYILNLRITNAKTLLRTTTYSVAEVAAIVGYDNPLYFSRLFKKQTGLPPSEFRNNETISM